MKYIITEGQFRTNNKNARTHRHASRTISTSVLPTSICFKNAHTQTNHARIQWVQERSRLVFVWYLYTYRITHLSVSYTPKKQGIAFVHKTIKNGWLEHFHATRFDVLPNGFQPPKEQSSTYHCERKRSRDCHLIDITVRTCLCDVPVFALCMKATFCIYLHCGLTGDTPRTSVVPKV